MIVNRDFEILVEFLWKKRSTCDVTKKSSVKLSSAERIFLTQTEKFSLSVL